LYALAIQFDPKNPLYQRRYDDLVEPAAAVAVPRPIQKEEVKTAPSFAPLFGLGLVMLAGVYVVFSPEKAMLPGLGLIGTWTVGLVAMLFFSGVVLGAALSLDGLLGRFAGSRAPGGSVPAPLALATVAIVSFWAAAAMYFCFASLRRAFSISTSRLMASVLAGTCILALAAEASGHISGLEVALWGGNLIYVGALCGWMVADAVRV
jgi:hypothetical protein